MTMEKSRVVFDCMIFLQAVMSEKSITFKLFELMEENAFTLFISNEMLAEVKMFSAVRISEPKTCK